MQENPYRANRPSETTQFLSVEGATTFDTVPQVFDAAAAQSEITAPGGAPEDPATEPIAPPIQQWLLQEPPGMDDNAREHIVALPFTVIRRFPAAHHRPASGQSLTPATAERLIAAAHEQHHMLAGGETEETDVPPGIIIPAVAYQVETDETGQTVIMSMAERVRGMPFDFNPWTYELPNPSQHGQAQQLAKELIRYYKAILSTKPALFLQDLATPDQYHITPNNTVTLVDTDPIMMSLEIRDGWTFLGNNIEQLALWVGTLRRTDALSDEQQVLLQGISALRTQYDELQRTYIPTLPGHL